MEDYWKGQDGFDQETAGEGNQSYAMTNEYTVALYFPNNVKDAINVEYDQKELGLSDILMDDFLGREWGSLFGSLDDALFESFAKAKQAMVSYAAYDAGVVMDNPKFNTYQGVSFRDHSYTFNLNPYNKADALFVWHDSRAVAGSIQSKIKPLDYVLLNHISQERQHSDSSI